MVPPTVLGAPAFLSGLTDADIASVKTAVAKRVAPEIAATKDSVVKALGQVEQGWRNARAQITERGGLKGQQNGVEK